MDQLFDNNPEKTLRNNKLFFAFVSLLIVTVVVYGYIRGISLQHHAKFTKGIVTSLDPGGKSHNGFNYSFELNGLHYKGSNYIYFKHLHDADFLVYRQFVVMYDSTNPNHSAMLIFPQEFERWGLPFPDSLNWIKKLINY